MLLADDQVIVPNTEGNLHIATYKLNQIITENAFTVFAIQKTKMVTFKGRDPFSSKIVIDKKNQRTSTFL